MKSPIHAYRKNKINTSSSVEHIAIILDQAARHIQQAIEFLEKGDLEQQSILVDKAMKLMIGLQGTLDLKTDDVEAQQVVEIMGSFYQQMSAAMMQATLKSDAKLYNNIRLNLQHMAVIWRNGAQR